MALLELNADHSGNYTKEEIKAVLYTPRGKDSGIWAHENLALAYAAYLSPKLAIEIREVFLRYKKGDEALVPEIRENKAKRTDKLRELNRKIGKNVRNGYTDTLKDHGVTKPFDYANCTNEVYKPLFGGTASKIKENRGLPKNSNLREHLDSKELAYAMAAEALATERIEHVEAIGYTECRDETKHASQAIGSAIISDRRNRQEKLN